MSKELSSAYDPKLTEERIYKSWEEKGYFKPSGKGKSYVIHLPPPNVTGSLHMGHALNAAITDVLIRYYRMKGYKTVWFPGTDHAGIATQNVVEKNLRKEGVSRWDLGREKFVAKTWEWKNKYGNIIIEQLKKLGASCDWSRLRFTMDPEYARWVQKAFIHYYEKDLIYRGKRVVSWCPRCQTSLSDLEIEFKEEQGKLWRIRYPIIKSKITNDYVIVATTRPETMLGDAAVAVNPKDKRYKNLIGKKVMLPIQNREIPVIADEKIDMNFGTGAVKVTPAHDLLDAEIGERHQLPLHQIIDERGRMTAEAGKDFEGLKVLEAREKVVQKLQELGLVEKIEDYKHNLAVCYRCAATLEPLLSNQWFLKMSAKGGGLAKKVLKTIAEEKVKIIPKNFAKTLTSWMENIKDWCISRQIWWGHQLPVWFCENQNEKLKLKIKNSSVDRFIVAAEQPSRCPFCRKCHMRQSTDVLDTWFSSALWPFAGLSEPDLKEFYPSNVLITARDIINLWVARMVFSGQELMKKTPFPEVLIHATILTKEGKRMSKSLGTGIDPLELIEKYGADATRFGIIWQAMGNQDIHWDEAAVMAGKKFANKIWNINRFVLGRIGNSKIQSASASRGGWRTNSKQIPKSKLQKEDKEILEKLGNLKTEVEKGIENYELGLTLHKIYDFIWHDFADKYIELSKQREDEGVKNVLYYTLVAILKILHPFMPFITETIYQDLNGGQESKWLIVEQWKD